MGLAVLTYVLICLPLRTLCWASLDLYGTTECTLCWFRHMLVNQQQRYTQACEFEGVVDKLLVPPHSASADELEN